MSAKMDELIEVVSTNSQFLRDAATALAAGEVVSDCVSYIETLADAILEAVVDFRGGDYCDEWIMAHADELKAKLLQQALAGKPRPAESTMLGRALVLFTTPPSSPTVEPEYAGDFTGPSPEAERAFRYGVSERGRWDAPDKLEICEGHDYFQIIGDNQGYYKEICLGSKEEVEAFLVGLKT